MPAPLVKSAQRTFEILELFESQCRPMRVGEIVERLGLPQSSASMLLKTLVARGYMEFDANTREFCPSARVSFLADWAIRAPGQRQAIQDMMRDLAQATGETVLVGRQSGLFVQYVSMIESRHDARLNAPPGTLRPMHRSAMGIMLLSTMDDEHIGRLLRRYNAELGKVHGVARIAPTMKAVELARSQGYYESDSVATRGAGVVATLLATRIRGHYLAVGAGGPVARLHQFRARIVPAVLRAGSAC
jgi:DNA-binding IclR family transcriptional regulator